MHCISIVLFNQGLVEKQLLIADDQVTLNKYISTCLPLKNISNLETLSLTSMVVAVGDPLTCWTGGQYNSASGRWEWAATGAPLSMGANWAGGYPIAADNQAAVLSAAHGFYMIDANRDTTLAYYLCERAAG